MRLVQRYVSVCMPAVISEMCAGSFCVCVCVCVCVRVLHQRDLTCHHHVVLCTHEYECVLSVCVRFLMVCVCWCVYVCAATTGFVPTEIGLLTNAQYISMHENQLSGERLLFFWGGVESPRAASSHTTPSDYKAYSTHRAHNTTTHILLTLRCCCCVLILWRERERERAQTHTHTHAYIRQHKVRRGARRHDVSFCACSLY